MDTFYPEVIQETPFPSHDPVVSTQVSSETGGTYSPTTTNEKVVPAKRIAVELLSQALNTRSLKILQEFELTQSGGIVIGDYKEGLTGDLRITPNGLVARDTAGVNTFSIDGTSGDAIFKGLVQAGSVITGAVAVGNGDILIDGETKRMIFYNNGIPSIVIGAL